VPARDGGRCEQQAADGESAAESCQKQAVGGEQVWSLDMAAQDGDFMPEGQQLEIALGFRPSAEQEDGQQQPGPEGRTRGARAGKIASTPARPQAGGSRQAIEAHPIPDGSVIVRRQYSRVA
jgi:hypothetical protein